MVDSTTTTPKPSVVRDVKVTDNAIRKAIRDFIKYLRQEKSAKDQKDDAADIIRKHVVPIRDGNALTGDYQKTYRMIEEITDKDVEHAVNVSQVDKWSKIEETNITTLKALVGDKFFDEAFEKVVTIKIKEEVMLDKTKRVELGKILKDALGVDGMAKYFEKEEVLVPKDGLEQYQYVLPKDKILEMRKLVKPSKDAVSDASKVKKDE
jgi:hypothetical protein